MKSGSQILYIFNPEHDLALATGKSFFTPPAQVVKLKNHLSLLPATYADNGDLILIPEEVPHHQLPSLPHFDVVRAKNITPVWPWQLPQFAQSFIKIVPWGWDLALYTFLLNNGCPECLLPSPESILNIRNLSHRRVTIPFRQTVACHLNRPLKNPASELFSLQEVENFLASHAVAYFKAPWSSSGRGIVVSDHISRKGLLEWSHGVLKKQGSVIAEPVWHRVADFASEWFIDSKQSKFLGYSVFQTSSRGKYHGNVRASQDELKKIIREKAPAMNDDIIEAQKIALDKLIAPFYSGPLGIDMLSDATGNINECVEINLRLTMGFILLDFKKKFL